MHMASVHQELFACANIWAAISTPARANATIAKRQGTEFLHIVYRIDSGRGMGNLERMPGSHIMGLSRYAVPRPYIQCHLQFQRVCVRLFASGLD